MAAKAFKEKDDESILVELDVAAVSDEFVMMVVEIELRTRRRRCSNVLVCFEVVESWTVLDLDISKSGRCGDKRVKEQRIA